MDKPEAVKKKKDSHRFIKRRFRYAKGNEQAEITVAGGFDFLMSKEFVEDGVIGLHIDFGTNFIEAENLDGIETE